MVQPFYRSRSKAGKQLILADKSKLSKAHLKTYLIIIFSEMLANIGLLILIILVKTLEAGTNCLYNQYFTIFNGQTSVTPYRVGGYQFSITWDTPQPNITASSYILIGFRGQNNSKLLSFEASIANVTSTGVVFNFNPTTNSQIISAQFSIALLKNCNAEVFLQYIEYIPSLLNKLRWERYGLSQQTLRINQTFNFSTNQYKSAIMISSITMLNAELYVRLRLYFNPINISKNYQQLVLSSFDQRNNSITKICLTYFLVGEDSAKSQLYIYSVAQQTPVNSLIVPTVFFPNATYKCIVGLYDYRTPVDYNPFSIIATPSAATSGPILYTLSIQSAQVLNYYVACLASCQLNYAPSYTSNTQTCITCLGSISNCVECDSFPTCLVCAMGYYLNSTSNSICQPCLSSCKMCLNTTFCLNCTNSTHYIVTNLCTDIQGCSKTQVKNLNVACIQCDSRYHLLLNTNDNVCQCKIGFYVIIRDSGMQCIKCLDDCYSCKNDQSCIVCLKGTPVDRGCTADSGCLMVNSSLPYEAYRCIVCDWTNFFTLVEGTCVCMQGYFQISNTCTNITGCGVAKIISNVFQCVNCNSRLNFQILPLHNTCICKEGYYVSNGKCLDICGDGKRYTNECDDGNLIDNDGCSKNCVIEPNFDCYGSNMERSKCIYLKYDIEIKLTSISKVVESNRGVFKFKITPLLESYSFLNLEQSVSLLTSKNQSIVSKQISEGQLSIEVEYTEDLEGEPAVLTFELNLPYFLQINATLDFKIVSNDFKLLVIQNQVELRRLSTIVKWISLLSLLIFFGSLYFHKMIGVQTIQNLQVIFLVHMINENYTEPFGVFSSLSVSALNFLFSAEQTTNIYSTRSNFKFDAYSQCLTEVSICLLTFLCLSFFMILSLIKKMKYKTDEKNQVLSSLGLIKMNQYIEKVYCNCVFPVSMGFFLVNFLIKVTENEYSVCHMPFNNRTFFLTILSSQIFFYETRYLTVSWQKGSHGVKKAKRYFISYYLVFQFLISATIILGYMNFGSPFVLEYYLTLLYGVFFVFFLLYRPYKRGIHNVGLLLNIFTTLSFLVWCSLRKMKLSDNIMKEGKEITAIYILICLLLLCLFVAVLRTTIEIKCSNLCKSAKGKIAKNDIKRFSHQQKDEHSHIQTISKKQKDLLKHHRAYMTKFNKDHRILSENINPMSFFDKSIQKRKKSNHEQLIDS